MKCYTIYIKTYLRSVLEHAVDMVVLYSSVSLDHLIQLHFVLKVSDC